MVKRESLLELRHMIMVNNIDVRLQIGGQEYRKKIKNIFLIDYLKVLILEIKDMNQAVLDYQLRKN